MSQWTTLDDVGSRYSTKDKDFNFIFIISYIRCIDGQRWTMLNHDNQHKTQILISFL